MLGKTPEMHGKGPAIHGEDGGQQRTVLSGGGARPQVNTSNHRPRTTHARLANQTVCVSPEVLAKDLRQRYNGEGIKRIKTRAPGQAPTTTTQHGAKSGPSKSHDDLHHGMRRTPT